jgi:hypothetical protein
VSDARFPGTVHAALKAYLKAHSPIEPKVKVEFARRTCLQLCGLNTECCKLCGTFRVTRTASPYQGEGLKSEPIAPRGRYGVAGEILKRRILFMPGWLEFLLFFAGYIVVMRWILPRFGVPS